MRNLIGAPVVRLQWATHRRGALVLEMHDWTDPVHHPRTKSIPRTSCSSSSSRSRGERMDIWYSQTPVPTTCRHGWPARGDRQTKRRLHSHPSKSKMKRPGRATPLSERTNMLACPSSLDGQHQPPPARPPPHSQYNRAQTSTRSRFPASPNQEYSPLYTVLVFVGTDPRPNSPFPAKNCCVFPPISRHLQEEHTSGRKCRSSLDPLLNVSLRTGRDTQMAQAGEKSTRENRNRFYQPSILIRYVWTWPMDPKVCTIERIQRCSELLGLPSNPS
jgi:hypothetical protein